jgi:hypothetical protein
MAQPELKTPLVTELGGVDDRVAWFIQAPPCLRTKTC